MTPYKHQLIESTFMCANKGTLLTSDAGTGKTISCFLAIQEMLAKGEIKVAFVVAPLSDIGEWTSTLDSYVPDLPYMVARGKFRDLAPIKAIAPKVIVTNHAMFQYLAKTNNLVAFGST